MRQGLGFGRPGQACGPLVPWSVVPWSLVLWSRSPLVPWSRGSLVPWSFGPLVSGPVVSGLSVRPVRPLVRGSLVPSGLLFAVGVEVLRTA